MLLQVIRLHLRTCKVRTQLREAEHVLFTIDMPDIKTKAVMLWVPAEHAGTSAGIFRSVDIAVDGERSRCWVARSIQDCH